MILRASEESISEPLDVADVRLSYDALMAELRPASAPG
jgi:hypothetical protein